MALPIDNLTRLSSFLAEGPRTWSVAVAARVALRALPIALDWAQWKQSRSYMSVAVLRANLISWAVGAFPAHEMAAASAAAAAASAAADAAFGADVPPNIAAAFNAAAAAAGYASDFAAAETSDSDAYAAAADRNAADDAAAAVWKEVWHDLVVLERGGMPALLSGPLWSDERDNPLARRWPTVRVELLTRHPSFKLWIDWYERRLRGERFGFPVKNAASDEEIHARLFAKDNDWWEQLETVDGAAKVNAEIQGWIDEFKLVGKPAFVERQFNYDFFISYSAEDEAFAREVVETLENGGFTCAVMYRDFGPGNFVTEMNDALDDSAHFMPLLSEAYVASEHCQAEWAYAYARDPAAKNWFIRALLAEPCNLAPLARQVNYKSMVGLGPERRKAVILDWARRKKRSKSADEAAETGRHFASPKPSLTDRQTLQMTPNLDIDVPINRQDLFEPVRQLHVLLDLILKGLRGNRAVKAMYEDLAAYKRELPEKGGVANWGLLDILKDCVKDAFDETDRREFGKALARKLEAFCDLHEQCKSGLKEAGDRDIELSEIEVDETAIGEAIDEPVVALEKAAALLKDDGRTEPSFDTTMETLAQIGREQAVGSVARFDAGQGDVGKDAGDAKEFGPSRKSWVVGTLGIVKEVYNLLGSTASLAAVPVVVTAMGYLEQVIAGLMRLIQ